MNKKFLFDSKPKLLNIFFVQSPNLEVKFSTYTIDCIFLIRFYCFVIFTLHLIRHSTFCVFRLKSKFSSLFMKIRKTPSFFADDNTTTRQTFDFIQSYEAKYMHSLDFFRKTPKRINPHRKRAK